MHEQIMRRIRGEYREMPDIRLRPEQVQRLCGIEARHGQRGVGRTRGREVLARFMHMVSCTALLVAGAASPTAQTLPEPHVDLSFGYEALHIPGQTYPIGVALGISAGLNDTVRIVGEAGVSIARHTASTYGAGTLTLYNYGAGPRVSGSAGPVRFYGQLLGGGVRTHADLVTTAGTRFIDGDYAFMLQPGAGVIVPFTRRIAAIGEGSYRRVFFKDYGGDNETRIIVGVRTSLR